jgi:hypothetical protein
LHVFLRIAINKVNKEEEEEEEEKEKMDEYKRSDNMRRIHSIC